MQARAAQPAIVAQTDHSAAVANEVSAEPTAQHVDIVVEQFFIGNAADVVFAKDPRVKHIY
jgi:hypothetical protein